MATSKATPELVTTTYDKLLDTKQVSELTGIPVGTLKQWRSSEVGPDYFALTGGTIRYYLRDVQKYIESSRRRASTRAS